MTSYWRHWIVFGTLLAMAAPIWAIDPPAANIPLCQQLKTHCVVVHYCPKPAPCVCYDYQSTCDVYCKKPDVCTQACFEWCTSIYCKKPEPCYPCDPCERQVWHTPVCPPPYTLASESYYVAQKMAF